MSFWSKWGAAPAPAPATVAANTQPLLISPEHEERVAQIEYRLSAIDRYIALKGPAIAADKLAHLENERIVKTAELAMLKKGA